jgi:ankyrin repeat protein
MTKNILLFSLIILTFFSCKRYLPGFDFKLFDNTDAEKLADAVKNEDLNDIERIVKENKTLIDFHDPKFGHTLLMLAVANDLEKSTEKLLELGADPNKKSIQIGNLSAETTTPMFIACSKIYKKNFCDTTILKMLIDYGGDINAYFMVKFVNADYETKETLFTEVTKSDCLPVIKLLINSGIDINDYSYENGHGPITNTILLDNLDVLKFLIIEKKIKIPNYVFVRHAYKNDPRVELTLEEFLNEQKYDVDSDNYRIRKEILEYLKNN